MRQLHKSGVIAVLFLIVAAFIFGAINLSMQTGQMIERRVKADQATDSASFAYASKSAQGLNFMAANNLAIAGASHMAGALHIAADWAIIVSAIFKSRPIPEGKLRPTDPQLENDHQIFYDIFKPATLLYFRIGTGLTTLNKVIKASFPYLGMVDAISTGGANAPSALFIPFQRGIAPDTAAPASGGSFLSDIKQKLLTLIQVLPAYQGLKYINSDETFCLAFEAGKKLGERQHPVAGWFNSDAFGVLSPLVAAINGLGQVVDLVGMFGGYIGLQVGYSNCGFAKTGKPLPGDAGNTAKGLIAGMLTNVLVGPLSGRSIELPMGDRTFKMPALPGKSAADLERKLNDKYRADCEPSTHLYEWDISNPKSNTPKLATPINLPTGVCVHPVQDDFQRHPRTGGWSRGTKSQGSDDDQNLFVQEYKVACHGTILFKWEGYSGLLAEPGSSPQKLTPAPDTNPMISRDDADSDLCRPFPANRPNAPWSATYPAAPTFGPLNLPFAPSWVNLTRKNSFLSPIINQLKVENPQDAPAGWKRGDPRPYTLETLSMFMMCALIGEDACPNNDAKGGYFESSETEDGTGPLHRFYPRADNWSWLCAATPEGDLRADGIREMLKFDRPGDDSRWRPSMSHATLTPDIITPSRYVEIQSWHNKQVDEFVDNMDCEDFDAYAKGYPVKQPPPAFNSNNSSHNFCEGGQHFCWQRGLQKVVGNKLKDGNLSFIVPERMTQKVVETTLEKSLHYAVLSLVPLRTDNKTDIVGASGSGPLPHCPEHLKVDAKLEDGTVVPVCDIQPLVGYISRTFTRSGTTEDRVANESFGGGNVNLASGGSLKATNVGTLGTAGFMSIAQSAVRYERIDANSPFQGARDEYQPDLAENATPKPSFSKNYQMFWPSWKPTIEPSRVMSHLLPPEVAYAVED